MNDHLTDGALRAVLDGEARPEELHHLEGCAACQARKTVLEASVQQTKRRLDFLASTSAQTGLPARAALRKFYNQTIPQKEVSMFKKLFASPIFRVGLAAALLVAVVLSVPTTRAFADRLLNLFRVQQVAVVPVDFTGMQQLTGDSTFGKQVSQLLSSSITMTQKPGDPVEVTDAAQASKMTGFEVRLPQDQTPSAIWVENSAAFTFKVDRARAQAVLDEAGRKDLVLPASIDGADISVNIPAGVSVAYGTCPKPQENETGMKMSSGSQGRRYPDCVMLAEIPSPTVEAPAEVNVAQLAQIGLEFTGMSAEQAAAFTKTVDWTSSLVIPIPQNAATYEQVPVDGVTGTLIQRPADDAPQYALIWVKNGTIYAVAGLGADSQKAIEMANHLK